MARLSHGNATAVSLAGSAPHSATLPQIRNSEPRGLAQRSVDPVLPTGALLLEMRQHIAVDAQRHLLPGAWHRRRFLLYGNLRRRGRPRLEYHLGGRSGAHRASWPLRRISRIGHGITFAVGAEEEAVGRQIQLCPPQANFSRTSSLRRGPCFDSPLFSHPSPPFQRRFEPATIFSWRIGAVPPDRQRPPFTAPRQPHSFPVWRGFAPRRLSINHPFAPERILSHRSGRGTSRRQPS